MKAQVVREQFQRIAGLDITALLREVEGLALQHDLAGHGARGVQQVVGHPRKVLHLARDDAARMHARFLVRAGKELACIGDGYLSGYILRQFGKSPANS